MNCFGCRQNVRPDCADEQVIPLPYFDDTMIYRRTVLWCMFRFDDVLEPEKLKSSLTKLLTLDGWSRLGARLRLNKKKLLEYHVPKVYSEERPAFLWSHIRHPMKAIDHESASHLPQASDVPFTTADSRRYRPLLSGPGFPTTLGEYFSSDIPQLGVHVVSFDDVTLISITWPHTFTDAMGFGAIMHAWSLVLQGREREVLPLRAAYPDPLASLGLSSSKSYKHANKLLSIPQLAIYGVRMASEKLIHRQLEHRVICVPTSTLEKLHQEASEDLDNDLPEGKISFVSEGDVLLAWWARIIGQQIRRKPKKPVTITQIFGHRSFHKRELEPSKYSHIGNAHLTVSAHCSSQQLFDLPLSDIALRNRQAVADLQSREQIESLAALHRRRKDRFGLELVSGSSKMHLILCSNWTKARLFELDFSAAIVANQGEDHLTEKLEKGSPLAPIPAGRPSFVHSDANFDYWLELRNHSTITGKDANGNYWLTTCLRKKQWANVEREMAQYTNSCEKIQLYTK